MTPNKAFNDFFTHPLIFFAQFILFFKMTLVRPKSASIKKIYEVGVRMTEPPLAHIEQELAKKNRLAEKTRRSVKPVLHDAKK